MTDVAAAPRTEPQPGRHDEPPAGSVARHPGDVVRLVFGLVLTAGTLAASVLTRDAVAGFEADLYRLLAALVPRTALQMLLAIVQVALVAFPAVVAVGIVRQREWRAALMAIAAGALTSAVLILLDHALDRVPPNVAVPGEQFTGSGILPADFPPVWVVAGSAAAITAAAPWISRPWRRALWSAVAVASLSRLLTGTELPVELFVALSIGWTIGSAMLVALGSPRPLGEDPDEVAAALREHGLPVHALTPLPTDARGAMPYVVTLDDGHSLFVKVLGRDQRDADLLVRSFRFLRYRGIEDESPFLTAKRALEHEALCEMMAERAGVRTPEVQLVADVGGSATLLAQDRLTGRRLDALTAADLDDALLRAVWDQVRVLHTTRLAHRDLRRSNVVLDEHGLPWLVDFGFAQLAASSRLLDIDVAELLCSLAVVVGSERAVTTAVAALGPESVAAALPFLQPPALSPSTRHEVRAEKGLLDQIRAAVAEHTGIEAVEPEKLVRISGRTVVYLAVAIGIVYLLLPQLSDLGESWQALLDANWALIPVVIVFVAVGYFANALVFMGTLNERLPVIKAFDAQLASAFANRITPANVGGMALRIRFLQKRGIDLATSASAVGLNSGATGAVKTVLLVVFVLVAGFGGVKGFDWDVAGWVALGLVVLLVLGWAVLFGTRWGRTQVLAPAIRALRNAVHNLRTVLTSPGKVLLLGGGSLLGYLANIAALFVTIEAMGGGVSFAKVGVVYLGGTTIAGAVPTPGNMGAVEAALIAGLSAAGLDPAVATSATLVFRLLQYWLPTLPAWFVFRHLEHTGQI